MLDFLSGDSKEQRQARRQREQQIKELKKRLEERQRAFRGAIELQEQSLAEKWEYLEISTKNTKWWGSLNRVGSMGWELVGVATFAEGAELKTIHTLYVFKRRVHDVPEELMARFADIPQIQSQIAALGQEK